MSGSTVLPGIEFGYVSGVYGTKGWIKIFSYTEPRENILGFPVWLLGNGADQPLRVSVEKGGWRGKSLVAKLAGVDTRDQAASLIGRVIFVNRAEFAELPADRYYWVDLVGLKVFTEDGRALGIIEGLLETGAHDVLIVRGDRERLIPFVLEYIVKSVDIEEGRLIAAWDPDF
ncbi:MAG: ribosome maturation factor RimM [Gammaproteobacteria bacterium]